VRINHALAKKMASKTSFKGMEPPSPYAMAFADGFIAVHRPSPVSGRPRAASLVGFAAIDRPLALLSGNVMLCQMVCVLHQISRRLYLLMMKLIARGI
jgi:hypothetical protein